MTASIGKSTTGINGIILHSAFHRPVKSGLKSFEYKKPSDETLHMLRNKPVLKSFDNEIPMIGRKTFGHLDLALKATLHLNMVCLTCDIYLGYFKKTVEKLISIPLLNIHKYFTICICRKLIVLSLTVLKASCC